MFFGRVRIVELSVDNCKQSKGSKKYSNQYQSAVSLRRWLHAPFKFVVNNVIYNLIPLQQGGFIFNLKGYIRLTII